MVSYAGKHAEYYDIFYQEKPYATEAAFVHECLNRYKKGECKRLLELACGTGSHAFELERLGYQIVAIDYSEDLLAIARSKAQKTGSHVDFRVQDMRELSLGNAAFDAAYCLFDSIGYVQTNTSFRQVLGGVHAHLRTDGLFIFEFWHAAAMLKNYEPKRERQWPIKDGKLIRVASTQLDVVKQLAKVTYDIDEIRNDGTSSHLQETQVNRYFLLQEMAGFLERAGFDPIEWAGAYSWEQAINEDNWHILCIA